MARTRSSPHPEVPGLAARKIAADILDGVLRRRIALDEQLSGKGAHIGLATLAERDRALMRRLVATVLRRLASSGTPAAGADAIPHPARAGILERYGLRTVGHFEEILQRGLIARAPWQDVVDEIASASPFLRGAPAFWAERIVRTETAGIYNRAGWEAIRSANEESGDFLKILSATFDDRTAADSYAVHGQIRRPDEPFESWYGLYHHPPNRPNDREVVVPHRMAWPIPPYLAWRSDREIAARWALEGRKGRPPPRPKMTTVPLSRIGKAAK